MSYCLNPNCPHPTNSETAKQCQQCGDALQLHNRYLALKPIGQGGFGRTFLAIDEFCPSRSRCVIKQFLPQHQGTNNLEKASELFRQEAQRLQELGEHPQIPALLMYVEQVGRQYLIQEFIDGQNLAQELEEDGIFSEIKIYQLLNDLLPVMGFIHEHQIIHRDIKPANIIRRATDKKLFLVDLGAAKYATGTALAITGTVIGSAEYTAPEQSRGKAVFASDLYSLGVTCIHLLTGMSPFDLYDSSEGRWVWRDYAPQSISAALSQILDKMLETPTNQRYRSAAEILIDLNQLDWEYPSDILTQPSEWAAAPSEWAEKRSSFANSEPPFKKQSAQIDASLAARGLLVRVEKPRRSLNSTPVEPQYSRVLNHLRLIVLLLLLGTPTYLRLITPPLTPRIPQVVAPSSSKAPVFYSSPSASLPLNASEVNPKFTNPVQPIQTFATGGQVISLAISPNSRTLVSGTDEARVEINTSKGFHDSRIQIWDLKTGKGKRTLTSHYPVSSLAISPDGKTLASQSVNITKNSRTLVAIMSDGKTVTRRNVNIPNSNTSEATVLADRGQQLQGTLQLWNLQTGKSLRTSTDNTFGYSIAFSSDGKFLAGNSFGQIYIRDVATGKTIQTLQAMSGAFSFNPVDNTLWTAPAPVLDGSLQPHLEVWNWHLGKRLYRSSMSHMYSLGAFEVPKLAISDGGQTLVMAYDLKHVYPDSSAIEIWNLQTSPPKPIVAYRIPLNLTAIAVSPDGSLTAAAGTRKSVEQVDIYDTRSGRLLRSLSGSSKQATSVAFTPDGKTLITGNSDGAIKVWNVKQLH